MHDCCVEFFLIPSQLLAVEVLRRPLEPGLAAVVRVRNQTVLVLVAVRERHVESIDHELSLQVVTHGLAAHDP